MMIAMRIYTLFLTIYGSHLSVLKINAFVTKVSKPISFTSGNTRSIHILPLQVHTSNITNLETSIVREISTIDDYVAPLDYRALENGSIVELKTFPNSKTCSAKVTTNGFSVIHVTLDDEWLKKEISTKSKYSKDSDTSHKAVKTTIDHEQIPKNKKYASINKETTISEREDSTNFEISTELTKNDNKNVLPEVIDVNVVESVVMKSQKATDIWETSSVVPIQGDSLRTCSLDQSINRVQIYLKTEGRPLNANIELWRGPNHIPQIIKLYVENGYERTFRTIVETPNGSNALSIRNTADLEFPCFAVLEPDTGNDLCDVESLAKKLEDVPEQKVVQGGAVLTIPFSHSVSSVQVLLRTYGRPLTAKIELLQGANQRKQVIEVYQENGKERPFFTIIETPGSGNVIRIINTATIEFPLIALLEVSKVENYLGEITPRKSSILKWS